MRYRIPIILTCIVLGAHFLRSGSLFVVILCLAAPFLLLVRRAWSLWALQGLAYFSALVWASTTLDMIQMRTLLGESWTRLAIILGTVILFSIFSGLLLNAPAFKARHIAQADPTKG